MQVNVIAYLLHPTFLDSSTFCRVYALKYHGFENRKLREYLTFILK